MVLLGTPSLPKGTAIETQVVPHTGCYVEGRRGNQGGRHQGAYVPGG